MEISIYKNPYLRKALVFSYNLMSLNLKNKAFTPALNNFTETVTTRKN